MIFLKALLAQRRQVNFCIQCHLPVMHSLPLPIRQWMGVPLQRRLNCLRASIVLRYFNFVNFLSPLSYLAGGRGRKVWIKTGKKPFPCLFSGTLLAFSFPPNLRVQLVFCLCPKRKCRPIAHGSGNARAGGFWLFSSESPSFLWLLKGFLLLWSQVLVVKVLLRANHPNSKVHLDEPGIFLCLAILWRHSHLDSMQFVFFSDVFFNFAYLTEFSQFAFKKFVFKKVDLSLYMQTKRLFLEKAPPTPVLNWHLFDVLIYVQF